LKNFYVGAGFNAFGIAAAVALAGFWRIGSLPMKRPWICGWLIFAAFRIAQGSQLDVERTLEAYGKHYTIGFPHEEYQSGRPRIVSPLYDRLKNLNACFGSKLGWERPNWFAPKGEVPRTFIRWGGKTGLRRWAKSTGACANGLAVFDQSSFSKYELRGKGAEEALNWICANNMSRASQAHLYADVNSRGGLNVI